MNCPTCKNKLVIEKMMDKYYFAHCTTCHGTWATRLSEADALEAVKMDDRRIPARHKI